MNEVLSGLIVGGYTVCGLFFLKFWKNTSDRLFLIFALAFWVLAAQRLMLVVFVPAPGAGAYLYLVRLLAFTLILVAIVDKNRIDRNRKAPVT
jgi:hypothetical protein